ncbi:molecular chaperone DnaJ [Candidatus Pacearchaeota archaeon]|nr:molecular chaperone DnaJ [Candidatus Pacearchaeota archaeon]
MAKKDYYEILGVDKDADKDTIKKAYKKLALKYHPDRVSDDKKEKYEEKFKEISEAYTILSDDKKRKQYDSFGHDAPNQGFGNSGFGGFSGDNLSDIFKDLFESQFGGGSFRDRHRTRVGDDLQYGLTIDFEEAAFGCEKEIEIRKNVSCEFCGGTGAKDKKLERCDKCHGEGRIEINQRTPFGIFRQVVVCDKCGGEGKIPKHRCGHCNGNGIVHNKIKIKIKIPQGIDNNQVVRVEGKGDSIKNGKNGNLFLIINIKPHKIFKRDGDDIYMDFSINFSQAALGCKISVPTLTGTKKIRIASGTESGTIVRLKEEGVENVNGYRIGDQFINLKIKTPKRLDRKQKKLFEELAKLEK